MASDRVERRLAAILAADVVGYSRHMGNDEEGAFAALKAARMLIDGLISEHRGRVFGSAGDSLLAEFASAVDAVRCAMAIQLGLDAAARESTSAGPRLRFRMGVHLGDVIVNGTNLLGDGVNVAARLEALAPTGGLLLSRPALDQVRDRLDVKAVDLGDRRVKNIARAIQVFRVPLASEERAPSPFRGLNVFDYRDAAVFFGRERAVADVTARLESRAADGRAFVLIYGMSGSGKSSLLRAGVLPALTGTKSTAGASLWRRCVMRPSAGPDPLAALAAALFEAEALPELDSLTTPSALAAVFRAEPETGVASLRTALTAAAEAAGAATAQARLVVAVNQFEEAFTTESASANSRAAFTRVLTALTKSGPVWVLAAIRADYFHRCGEIPGFAALRDGLGSFELAPPTNPEIARMISEPARLAGLRFEEDANAGRLADVLQQAAADDPASLPLLQFTLDALEQAAGEQRLMSFAAYRALGGLEGAISRRADEVADGLGSAARAALPSVIRALATVDIDDRRVTARAARRAEADATQSEIIDAFVAARLLVADEDASGEPVVRVAHEALLRHWPRARTIVEADADFLAMRARVQADAQVWEAADRADDLLLPPGRRLAEAEELLATRRRDVDAATAGYIEASTAAEHARLVAAEEHRDREEAARRAALERESAAAHRLARRTRIAATVTLALALIATAGAVAGLLGQREAEEQASAARAAEAQARAAGDAAHQAETEALRLSAAALEARDEMLVNQSLFLADLSQQSALAGDADASVLLALEALPSDMTNPDRPYVVHAEAALYRALLARLEYKPLGAALDAAAAADWSPDGERVVVGFRDGSASVFEVLTGTVVATSPGQRVAALSTTPTRAIFSHDGRTVASTYDNKMVRLWNAATGAEIASIDVYSNVIDVAFSPDDALLATTSSKYELWNTSTGQLVAEFPSAWNADVVFSPTGDELLTISGYPPTSSAILWPTEGGPARASFEATRRSVTSVAISPDAKRVLTTSLDDIATLWRRCEAEDCGSSWTRTTELAGHRSRVVRGLFSPDGTLATTVTADGTVRLWRADTGRLVRVMGADSARYPISDAIAFSQDRETDAAFSPDGTLLFVASRDRELRLWNVATGVELAAWTNNGRNKDVAFNPNGDLVVTASHDGGVQFWDVDGVETAEFHGPESPVNFVDFGPGDGVVLTASGDGVARVWNVATRQVVARLDTRGGVLRKAVFSPDGGLVATLDRHGAVVLFDAARSATLARQPEVQRVADIAFSPLDRRIAMGLTDGDIVIWDLQAGRESGRLVGHEDEIRALTFSPDGALLASASRDRIARVWDVASGESRHVLSGHARPVNAIAFSPGGDVIVTAADDGTISVWETADGALRHTFDGHQHAVLSLSIDLGGASVASASRDHTVRIWPIDGGAPLLLAGHGAAVMQVTFSPNGRHVLSVSQDRTARLWDAESGYEIGRFHGHVGQVRYAVFDTAGEHAIVSSGSGAVRIYNVYPTTQHLIDRAQAVVSRDLTPCERARYFLSATKEVECLR